MSKKHCFLVSYIIDNQPQSTEVEAEEETLTPEQARYYLESLHRSTPNAHITDVQVTKILHSRESGTTPGHYPQS